MSANDDMPLAELYQRLEVIEGGIRRFSLALPMHGNQGILCMELLRIAQEIQMRKDKIGQVIA